MSEETQNAVLALGALIGVWLVFSIFLWPIRAVMPNSCEHLYMDYVFPITMLHCPVKPEPTHEKR